jgi:PAS domain S-box-containing protein
MHKPNSILSFKPNEIFNAEKQTLDKRYQDSETSFKAIFERSPFGNVILSKDMLIVRANTALQVLLDVDGGHVITGSNILQYAHPDYRTDWLLLQQHLWIMKSPSFTTETCMLKSDGTCFWCKITAIVYHENGNTLGYTIIEDISKRKNDEDTIKRSQANLLTILDHAEAGYVLYNSKLRIVAFNALAEKFSGLLYSKKLKEDTYILDYFPEDRHAALLDVTYRVMKGDNVYYERMITNPNGKNIWMETNWINVKDADDKSWGFILTSKDITESKVAAMEREKITHELTQRNKSLEQFTNITSHNLRAPVANIIGLAQLIEEAQLDEDEKSAMMNGILLSARKLDMVITDINDILQVKELSNESKEKIDLHELVSDIKIIISSMIYKENATIKCNFGEIPYIFSVRSYMYSIFYNMILNSLKYRRADADPVISLSSRVEDDKIQLAFTDNGKGIDMERNGGNLFGLYKRFDTSVSGRGLGLFMVKSQIETLQGTITVKSELGKGTSFFVEFPLL